MRKHKKTEARPSDSRSADAYIEAANAAISSAEMAVPQLKKRSGGGARIAGAVEDAVPHMRIAAEQLSEVAPSRRTHSKEGCRYHVRQGSRSSGGECRSDSRCGDGSRAALEDAVGTARDSIINAAEARSPNAPAMAFPTMISTATPSSL